MLRSAPLNALFVCALASACGDGGVDVVQVADYRGESGRYGLIALTAQLGEPGVAVTGQLLDYHGIDRRDALLALASPELAWLADAEVNPGTCRLLDAEARGPAPGARVDLLDAGPLVVRAPDPLDELVQVAPRDLPPLVAALAGVVYDADRPLPYLAGGTYRLQTGGGEIGPLSAQVEAPGPVWIEGLAFDDAGLDVRIGGGPEALLLVTRLEPRPVAAACRPFEGAESLRVPPEALRHLGAGPVEVALVRLRRVPLVADGPLADGLSGAVLFITRDATWLTLPDLVEERVR